MLFYVSSRGEKVDWDGSNISRVRELMGKGKGFESFVKVIDEF